MMKFMRSLFAVVMPLFASARGGDLALEAGGMKFSKAGYQLVLDYEVGGGKPYYVRYLQRPTLPPAASGVTIGVGYDLRYNSASRIASDWHMLPAGTISRLQRCSGVGGAAAKLRLREVKDIVIPWEAALEVYNKTTIPRFAELTRKTYPGVETLHPHIQSAMWSWTFNRGEDLSDIPRNREKRSCRYDIPDRPHRLPTHFRSSKRLWPTIKGLLLRRESEAKLIELGLKK